MVPPPIGLPSAVRLDERALSEYRLFYALVHEVSIVVDVSVGWQGESALR
jgi:hypothetical protein